jgi:hypothetical protein
MKLKSFIAIGLFLFNTAAILQAQTEKPIVNDKLIFEEKDGMVAVEAELFYKQTLTEIRQWYITSSGKLPSVTPDHDPQHIAGASNNAYIEILPDTRVTHGDKLINGENFSNVPGKLATVHYKVKINNPGRYYVWVRCYSSGSEDNGLHVGFNDTWPEHGQRMQWCEGKMPGHGEANSAQRKNIAEYQKKSISISTKPVFMIFSSVCAKTVSRWTSLS